MVLYRRGVGVDCAVPRVAVVQVFLCCGGSSTAALVALLAPFALASGRVVSPGFGGMCYRVVRFRGVGVSGSASVLFASLAGSSSFCLVASRSRSLLILTYSLLFSMAM